MKYRSRNLLYAVVLLAGLMLPGCHRNPQVAKQTYFDKGTQYFQQGKYNEAAIEFQNALQIDPDFADAHYQLAQCYLKRGSLRQAYPELVRTVDLTPANLNAQLDLARLLLDGRKVADARSHAEIVLKSQPQNAQAQLILSDSDALQGNLPHAIEEAQSAIRMDPQHAASYLNLAILQERNRDFASAERNFQAALAADPHSVSAFLTFGSFYARQKRWPDAEKQFQSAMDLDPKDTAPRVDMAELYLAEGHKDKAEDVLRAAKAAMSDNPAGYRLLGDFYLRTGDPAKAADEFASLHAQHPKDAGVANTYVDLLLAQNRVDAAAQVEEAFRKQSPAEASPVLHAEILIRQGKVNDAISILESTVHTAPDNVLAHYQLGLAYADAANFGQAQAEWLKAAQLRPDWPDPERAVATYAARSGNVALLLDSSEQLIRTEPHSSEGYVFHARALAAKKDPAGADADLKKAIAAAPQDAAPYAREGDLAMGAKQFDRAAKFYSQALALNPAAPDALAGLVTIDLQNKQPELALRHVQEQIARVPNSSNFYLLLGQVELRNKDAAKAEEAFQKAVDLDKNNVTAFILLAGTQVSRGSAEQAIQGYQHAIEANPRDVRLYVNLAAIYETRGDWQKAQDYYQKALQVEPDYPVAANNLAYLMLEHDGNVNVALSLAQTGRRGLPDFPNSADTLGWADYRQGVYNAAIDMLQQAVKEDPKNPTYHYHLGMAYQKSGNLPMARKEFQTSLEINPQSSHADEMKQLMAQAPQGN